MVYLTTTGLKRVLLYVWSEGILTYGQDGSVTMVTPHCHQGDLALSPHVSDSCDGFRDYNIWT